MKRNETTFDKALAYVKENKTWSEAADLAAIEKIDEERIGISQADPDIADEIHDLMEEYSADNDLPEGWWYEFGDEDDVFLMLDNV